MRALALVLLAAAPLVRWRWAVGALAGAVLVFVLSLGVFLEPKVMGGGTSPMAAELVRQSFETRVNWPLGAALTIVLIVIGAAVLAIAGLIAAQRMRRTS